MDWIEVYQYYMWQQRGLFVRGSLVYGDLYDDDNIMFGPALINAYKMEKKADWARVILDHNIIELFNSLNEQHIGVNIRSLNDKYLFLDYLKDYFCMLAQNEIDSEKDASDLTGIESLQYHKNVINHAIKINNNRKTRKQSRINKILLGVAAYHNAVVDDLLSDINKIIDKPHLISEIISDNCKDLNRYTSLSVLGSVAKRLKIKKNNQELKILDSAEMVTELVAFSKELKKSIIILPPRLKT